MSVFISNPTDTNISPSNISFSILKNAFGSSGPSNIKLSEFTVPIIQQLGTGSNIGSFANKKLQDPVVSITSPITFVSKVYVTSPTNPTLTMGVAYPFQRLDNYKFVTTNLLASFTQNPYQAVFTTLNASTNTVNIQSNGIPAQTLEYNNTIIPITVNIRKRNNFIKPIYSANVNASQIVFPYHMTVTTTPTSTPQHHHHNGIHNYHNHHHGIHHIHHNHAARHHGIHTWSHDLPGGYGKRHNHHVNGRHHGIHHANHTNSPRHDANHHNDYLHTQAHNFYTSSSPVSVTEHNSDLGTNAQVASYFSLTSVFQSATSTCTNQSSHTFNSGCTSKYKVRITLPWNNTQVPSSDEKLINLTANAPFTTVPA